MALLERKVKRKRPNSRHSEEEMEDASVDRISQLPTEIIVSILCRLSLKEAAITGVLSKRWEKLWTYISDLDFDASKTTHILFPSKLAAESCKYVQWVNKVIGLHQCQTINNFNILFPLKKPYVCCIDEWVKFAIRKKVRSLDIDLSQSFCSRLDNRDSYNFSHEALFIGRSQVAVDFFCFKSLTSLSLKFVRVRGEVIEYFLTSCPLERLCVTFSDHLVNLKVPASSIRLRHLEISYCFKLSSLLISAPNIVSFKYYGPLILSMENVPLLVEASIGGPFRGLVNYAFGLFSSCLSPLEILSLKILVHPGDKIPFGLPLLTKLKKMVLDIHTALFAHPILLVPLLNSAPYMHELVLKLNGKMPQIRKKVQKTCATSHEHLKVVEIIGFQGTSAHVEFVRYIIKISVGLEKIVIDPRHPYVLESQFEPVLQNKWKRAVVKNRAMKLKKNLPPGAKLVFL